MKKFYVIIATMSNGDKWETRRHTSKGMNSVVQDIIKDKDVTKFSVEER